MTGLNVFAYCGNNPVNRLDINGNLWVALGPCGGLYPSLYDYMLYAGNYAHNSKVDNNPNTTTKNKPINDQNGSTGNNFKYGNYSASHNACETIAVHNAKYLKEIDTSLSETMLDFQLCGAMIGDGYFGSNPYKIGKVLEKSGIEYSMVDLDKMDDPGIYIISFWNSDNVFDGLHTVAVVKDGLGYTTYNFEGDGETSDESPSAYAKNYICGYYLR